jgi:hypothetical protein
MKQKVANQVRVTDDYDRFTVTKENRGIVSGHVRKLARSMNDYGWIDSFPMMVVARGDKLEIRDGQNRFRAAQHLGIPVKYVLTENGQSAIPIAELNKYQKTWTVMDHCKSYANEGDKDYQALLKFMTEENINLIAAVCLLSQGSPNTTTLKNGNFKVRDLEWARKSASHLRHLCKVMPWSPNTANFVRVFVKACLVQSFNPGTFAKKVEQSPEKVVNMATEAGISAMMEEVYNYRNRQPIPLAYEISRVAFANHGGTAAREKAREKAAAK